MGFTSRSVNLSWTPPLNAHNSPVSHYLIQIRVGEDGGWDGGEGGGNLAAAPATTAAARAGLLETPGNATVFQVNDLQPFTTYSFRVTAVNGMGNSRHSKESYYMLTLREVPSGKPTITAAHNTSSTSIQLRWRPPHPSTLHGEFLGYRIAYRTRNPADPDNAGGAVREILIKDPTVEQYTIQRLAIFTQYLVSLQVFTCQKIIRNMQSFNLSIS